VLALAGAVLVACGQDVADIVIGRILTGSAFGLDFAVAIAMLAELTPARLRHRLNCGSGTWPSAATCCSRWRPINGWPTTACGAIRSPPRRRQRCCC
jgi:MFS family permease